MLIDLDPEITERKLSQRIRFGKTKGSKLVPPLLAGLHFGNFDPPNHVLELSIRGQLLLKGLHGRAGGIKTMGGPS